MPVIIARCGGCGSTTEAPNSDSAANYVEAHNEGIIDIRPCSDDSVIVGIGV